MTTSMSAVQTVLAVPVGKTGAVAGTGAGDAQDAGRAGKEEGGFANLLGTLGEDTSGAGETLQATVSDPAKPNGKASAQGVVPASGQAAAVKPDPAGVMGASTLVDPDLPAEDALLQDGVPLGDGAAELTEIAANPSAGDLATSQGGPGESPKAASSPTHDLAADLAPQAKNAAPKGGLTDKGVSAQAGRVPDVAPEKVDLASAKDTMPDAVAKEAEADSDDVRDAQVKGDVALQQAPSTVQAQSMLAVTVPTNASVPQASGSDEGEVSEDAGDAPQAKGASSASVADHAEAKGAARDAGVRTAIAPGDGASSASRVDTGKDANEGRTFSRDLASARASTGGGQTGGEVSGARGDSGSPSGAWLSQTMAPIGSRPSALPYPAAAQATPTAAASTGEVQVREGRFGSDMGVQIARALDSGSDDLLIKLDPRHMGRIDVRLSFDHDGVLRATMSADNSGAADMLRRESGDLVRSLADAGIRADGQSLRFDTRAGGQSGQGGGQGWSGSQGSSDQRGNSGQGQSRGRFAGRDEPVYRSLGASGHVDLIA